MGFLASGSAYTCPSAQPPIDTSGNCLAHLSHLINSHLIYIFKLLENGTEDQHHHHPQQDHHAAHENVASDGR